MTITHLSSDREMFRICRVRIPNTTSIIFTNSFNSSRPFPLNSSRLLHSLKEPQTNQSHQHTIDAKNARRIFDPLDTFARRHIGPSDIDIQAMCSVVGVKDLADLVSKTLPANIRIQKGINDLFIFIHERLDLAQHFRKLKQLHNSKQSLQKTKS